MAQVAQAPHYHEFRPPRALTGLIEVVWDFSLPLRATDTEQQFMDRVLPDGCAEIMVRLDGGQGHPFVRGPLARFDLMPLAPGSRYVGARRIKPEDSSN